MLDVITIGESMVMMIAEQDGPLETAVTFSRHLAGAESNVAIGLTRLGHKVGWISAVGDDPFGVYVQKTIFDEGVDTSAVAVLPGGNTGLLVKEKSGKGDPRVYYYRKGSAACRFSPNMLNERYFDGAKLLHITGIFPALSLNCRETLFTAIKLAKQRGIMISFDPNIRLKLWTASEAKQILLQIAAMSDLILPGLQEAYLLTGTTQWEEVAAFFHGLGNKFVVMKNGADGAFFSTIAGKDTNTAGYVKGFRVSKVVDTVGAGDGFAAGVLSGVLNGLPLQESVQRGNAIGAMAVTVYGDYAGYPTLQQLDDYIKVSKGG